MSAGVEGVVYKGVIDITDDFLDEFMKSDGIIEAHSTLLLTIDVNMANWCPQKLAFYKKFIATVTIGSVIKVRGTIFDDCFPVPVEFIPTISPVKFTEINQHGMFSKFEMDMPSTPTTDNRLLIIKTADVPSYAEIAHLLEANSIELIQKKLFSKGFKLLQTVQEAFGSVKLKLKHESGHEIELMPDELVITLKKDADHTIYSPITGERIIPRKRRKNKSTDDDKRLKTIISPGSNDWLK